MLKINSLALMLSLILVGCASPQVAYKPAQMPELPAELSTKLDPNLSDRLLKILSPSQQTATTPSASSTPALTSTTK